MPHFGRLWERMILAGEDLVEYQDFSAHASGGPPHRVVRRRGPGTRERLFHAGTNAGAIHDGFDREDPGWRLVLAGILGIAHAPAAEMEKDGPGRKPQTLPRPPANHAAAVDKEDRRPLPAGSTGTPLSIPPLSLPHLFIQPVHGVHHTINLRMIMKQVGGYPQGIGIPCIFLMQMKFGRPDHITRLLLEAVDKIIDLFLILHILERIEGRKPRCEFRYIRGKQRHGITKALLDALFQVGTQPADVSLDTVTTYLFP
jgi:hypothetical protein